MRNALINAALAASLALASCSARDEALEAAVQRGVDKSYPGVAAGYERAGGRPHFAAKGLADIENNAALHALDCFHIGSITKTFTAVAALHLVDEGKLARDAKVIDLLGSDLVGKIPYIAEITVSQLIDHSSGIYPTNNDLVYLGTILGEAADPKSLWTPEQYVQRAYTGVNEPHGRPGEDHYYSDTNYILLGLVVEKVAGQPLKEIVAKKILTPLGMSATTYVTDQMGEGAKPPRKCVQGYMYASQNIREFITISPIFKPVPGRTMDGVELLNTTLAQERIDGAGGILSTLPDLLKFGEALFRGKLLSEESQNFLLASAEGMDAEPVGESRVWAMQADHKEFGVIVHKGGDGPGGATATLAYHPQSKTVFAGFTNSFGHFDEADFLLDDVMAAAVAGD